MVEYFGGTTHDQRELRIDFPANVVFVPYPRHGTGAWVRSVFIAAVPRSIGGVLHPGDIVQQCSEPGARGGVFGTVCEAPHSGTFVTWDMGSARAGGEPSAGSVEYIAAARPPRTMEARALRVVIVFANGRDDPADWTTVHRTVNGVSWVLRSTLRYMVPGCDRPLITGAEKRTEWLPSYVDRLDPTLTVSIPERIDPCIIDLSYFDTDAACRGPSLRHVAYSSDKSNQRGAAAA